MKYSWNGDVTHLLDFLYLGLGASALCFVTWNFAVKALGAVKISVYIYMVPVITVVTSVLVLKEQVISLFPDRETLICRETEHGREKEKTGGEILQRTGGLKDGFTE